MNLKQKIRNIKSWMYYRSRTYYDVLTYDENAKRYILTRHTITEKDAPIDALAVTGDKHHWFKTDLVAPPRGPISAISNYLYLINNDINDGLASNWRGVKIDAKTLAIVGAVVIGVVVWVAMRGLP